PPRRRRVGAGQTSGAGVNGVSARLRALADGFAGKTVVVIGDVITDEYLYGKPARISREAPVLILRFTEREVSLGGAANAAHNVHALGARPLPIGVIGRDGAGDELLTLFRSSGIPTDGLVTETGRVTPIKTRIMAGGAADDERDVEKAGRQLLERLDARFLLVTRGSRGMALLERDGATTFIPVHGTDEIADVTGAGDTVISVFTLALACGAPALDAATLANVAGGIVVMKRGTATLAPSELRQALGGATAGAGGSAS